MIQVAWEGGVVPIDDSLSEADLFQFSTLYTEGGEGISPVPIADIEDNDNFHQLCMTTIQPIVSVSVKAGVVEDPNGDSNPVSTIAVSRCGE